MKQITLILIVAFGLLSFTYPKNMDKKIRKEITKTLNLSLFDLEPINVDNSLNLSAIFKPESLFKIKSNQKLLGYFYFGQAKGKAANFDYMVILDKDLIISKISLLAYRESYGGEIGSVRWLKQFIGLNTKSTIKYKQNIAGISGATISGSSLTRSVNKLMKALIILKINNQL